MNFPKQNKSEKKGFDIRPSSCAFMEFPVKKATQKYECDKIYVISGISLH